MSNVSGFSVIMPTYNQAAFIRNAIQSLFSQSYTNWELIIINDGCTDMTEKFIIEYLNHPKIIYLKNNSNKGLGYSINQGLDVAKYSHIAYLPSDDFFYKDHLETLKHEYEQKNNLVLVYTRTDASTQDTFIKKNIKNATNGLTDLHSIQLVQTSHINTSDRWITRSEWESEDLFDLFFKKLVGKGSFKFVNKTTSRWLNHPLQRHKILSESFGGNINRFKLHYGTNESLKIKISENKFFDEKSIMKVPTVSTNNRKGLKILLVGELSSNPERVCALINAGHKLYGLWTQNPTHSFHAIGPFPYCDIINISYQNWTEQVKKIQPDIIYALQSFGAVSIAHEVMTAKLNIPFVWHCKEGPSASLSKGDWDKLIDLYYRADGKIYINEEAKQWYSQFMPESGSTFIMDGDLPLRDYFTDDFSPKLSDSDGDIHTVVSGRLVGLTPDDIATLADNNIHVHLYTENYYNSRLNLIKVLSSAAPYHFHIHDHCPSNKWVSEFSKYDAGWLHCFDSTNEGDIKRAGWDDLNIPARINTLAAAGLPMIQKDNTGNIVAMQRIVKENNMGIFFDCLEDLIPKLQDKELLFGLSKNVIQNRMSFTFDNYVPTLITFFKQVISNYKCTKKIRF